MYRKKVPPPALNIITVSSHNSEEGSEETRRNVDEGTGKMKIKSTNLKLQRAQHVSRAPSSCRFCPVFFLGEKSARFVAAKSNAVPELASEAFLGREISSDVQKSCGALCGFIFQQARLFNQYPAARPIQCQRTPMLRRNKCHRTRPWRS